MPLTRIDHVQLAMPPGGEVSARQFYTALPGLSEVAKPPELVARLRNAGCPISEDGLFEGFPRVYVDDPFGNRIELIAEV